MSSGHLLLSCAKRAATTKIDLFAYLWQLPCALCSLILMTLATGTHIKALMDTREVTVQDVQDAMGLASPQAVYRWLRGSNMPSVDNLYALSRYLNVSMEDVIVEKAA